MSNLWVDKYKPKSTHDLFGQTKNVGRIKSWLKTYEPVRSKPLFISGPPGIGKTTAAHLCCKEAGYQVTEFNASDQRNKKVIEEVIRTAANNSRIDFIGRASDTKSALILDEVDGMAGNEDRGGIQQLIAEIKFTKKPMIFICNDGQAAKLRSLKDKCENIEFRRPDFEAIRMVVSKIAQREGLKLNQAQIKNLIETTQYDIRQVINSLYLFKDGSSAQVSKSSSMNIFEAAKKALSPSTYEEKSRCYFTDYNIMNLFIFENYLRNASRGSDNLRDISRAADSMCLGDLFEKQIRTNQSYHLLTTHGFFSTILPASIVQNPGVMRIEFPQYLGKFSNAQKRARLTQELNAHMCLTLRGGLDPDTLEVMCDRLSQPLIKKDLLGGIDAAVDFMCEYSLLREDFNSIMELATWSSRPDPMTKVDSKTKTNFTLAYKKRSITLPYFSEDKVVKKKKTLFNDASDEEDDYEEDDEPIIKPKKVTKNDKPKVEPKAKKAPVDPEPKKQPEKRKDGGIAKFFIAKKQKC